MFPHITRAVNSYLYDHKSVCYNNILMQFPNKITFSDDKWQGVKAASNEQRKLLEDIVTDLRTYKDAGVHLQKWIAQKEKMVAVLGPVATEPSMIKNQLEQVKVC